MAHVEYPAALVEEARKLGVELGSGEDYDPSEALETLGEEIVRVNGDTTPVKWNDDPDDPFAGDPFEDAAFGGFSFKKLGRGIIKGVKKVARNPIVQIMNPALAISAHTTNKALGGKAVIKGPLGKVVDAGTAGVMKVVPGGAMGELGKKFGSALPKTAVATARAVSKTVTKNGVVSFGIKSPTLNVKSAMAAADKLLGDPKVGNAALVVRNTKALAALGDPSAKRGLAVLNSVATIRKAKKVPPGKSAVPKAPIPKAAVIQKTTPAKVTAMAKAVATQKKVDAKNKTWVAKVLGWFGLEAKKS